LVAATRDTGLKEEKRMRKIVIATLIAAGVALAGTAAGSAAPATNVLQQAKTAVAPAVKVQYYYPRRRCHGYYSHWHWC
jgi:hypothetical protein